MWDAQYDDFGHSLIKGVCDNYRKQVEVLKKSLANSSSIAPSCLDYGSSYAGWVKVIVQGEHLVKACSWVKQVSVDF